MGIRAVLALLVFLAMALPRADTEGAAGFHVPEHRRWFGDNGDDRRDRDGNRSENPEVPVIHRAQRELGLDRVRLLHSTTILHRRDRFSANASTPHQSGDDRQRRRDLRV